MSKKRKVAELSDNEQVKENSNPLFQQDKDAKREKLDAFRKTTLQDLPIEMVECILVRAVVMEVKDMKLVKSVWKEKADPVISRLQTVCSQWNNILTTNFFQKEVHRILDDTAEGTIHMEILHQSPIQFYVFKVAAMNDEIFLLCRPHDGWNCKDYAIKVCERNNVGVVKDVIQLPGITDPLAMEACSVSNCLYILNELLPSSSIWRITKDEGHPYNVSNWITGLKLSLPILSVSTNGNLAFVAKTQEPNRYADSVYIFNAKGSLHGIISLYDDSLDFLFRRLKGMLLKPNGNLLLTFARDQFYTELLELDTRGSLVREYTSKSVSGAFANVADIYGRIWTVNCRDIIELVDSELHPLAYAGPPLPHSDLVLPLKLYFNADRNEIVRISYFAYAKTILTIFRFTDK